MKMRNILGAFGALSVLTSLLAPAAKAQTLTAQQASAIVQSAVADSDIGMLTLLTGQSVPPVVSYSSALTGTGWTATTTSKNQFAGIISGHTLSVATNGNTSGYPGAITWSSTGSYDTNAWSGSGSATIVSNSSTSFTVQIAYSVSIGSGSAAYNYQIPGTINLTTQIISYNNGEAGTGSGTYTSIGGSGVQALSNLDFSFYDPESGGIWSQLDVRDEVGAPNTVENFWNLQSLSPSSATLGGTIGPEFTVPAMPIWGTILLGGIVLMAGAWQFRRFRANPAGLMAT